MPMCSSDLAACRRLLAEGSRSFDLAARLLPRGVRADATVLYAFCRLADDAVDCGTDPERSLAGLHSRLAAIYAGRPMDAPVDRAMTDVVQRHDLPQCVVQALLEGLAWDVAGREYETLSALRGYAVRVAGTVGLMMTTVMDRRDPETLTRAAELGVAMQLTNIARDVGEDAAIGRCYIPRAWRYTAAGEPLGADPRTWPAADVARIVQALLVEADRHYARAMPGIAALPRGCRVGIRAAARMYRAIGHEIAAGGHDSVHRRAVVSRAGKLRALLGWTQRDEVLAPSTPATVQPLPEAAVLVTACSRATPVSGEIQADTLAWWQIGAQWAWVIQLFGKLAVRERLDRAGRATSNEDSKATLSQQR